MTKFTGRAAEMAAWAKRQRRDLLSEAELRQVFATEFRGATQADFKRAFDIHGSDPGDDGPA